MLGVIIGKVVLTDMRFTVSVYNIRGYNFHQPNEEDDEFRC